jgi:hypothetical protein
MPIDTDSDPCELLADLVCAHLNATPDEKGIIAAASNPEQPQDALNAADSALTVLVVPGEETEEKIGRDGQVQVTYPVNLIIFGGVEKSKHSRRDLSDYAYRRRRALRAVTLGEGNRRFKFTRSEVIVKFDPANLNEGNDFFHVAQITYASTD